MLLSCKDHYIFHVQAITMLWLTLFQQPLVAEMHIPATGEGNVNGLGLELYIEATGSEMSDESYDFQRTWQFLLLNTISQLAAGADTIAPEQPKGNPRKATKEQNRAVFWFHLFVAIKCVKMVLLL